MKERMQHFLLSFTLLYLQQELIAVPSISSPGVAKSVESSNVETELFKRKG